MTLVLGLDVGTQGTKGVVLDTDGQRVVARAGRAYDLIAGLPPGAAEQHPRTWIDAVESVVAELVGREGVDGQRIAALGVSGQQHGLVVLDAAGAVVRPAKLWCDTATASEARELSERLGRHVPTGFTASKILWLARHEPDAWERVAAVLLPHDYVNFVLTGERCMEAGDASGTGLFDPVSRAFVSSDTAALDARLPELLPPLREAGEPAGHLLPAVADRLGLTAGIPVAAGGGDNMMSAVGSGATHPGVVVLSLGTSGTVFTYSDAAVVDPEGLIAPFCDSTGGWLPLLCVMNVTGVTEEVRAAAGGLDHAQLTSRAADVAPGCDGLMLVPYLLGERVPDLPQATGSLHGVRPGLLDPGHLYRAALEGTSLNLAWGVQRMRALGLSVDGVRLVGGGAANPLWRRILADALDAPVRCLLETESAALGAALCGLWTLRRAAGEALTAHEVAAPFVHTADEVIEPEASAVAGYAQQLERFRELVARLH